MPFLPVVLVTDALVFVLVAAVLAFAWVARRREHLRAPWRRVAASRAGMTAATVLAVFVVVGLLDTVHFRPALPDEPGKPRVYAGEVLSLLDALAAPLRSRKEKTYSAPFATHLFAKEAIELADGRQVRDFPRLRHGGAHLSDPARDRAGDIARRAAAGCLGGAVIWVLVAGLLALRQGRARGGARAGWRAIWRGETHVPWHAVLITLAVILALGGAVVALAPHYHVFGTDKVGQDVFYQALKSVRTGLVIGTLTTLVMLPFALLLGIMAAYYRGWVDDVIQYLYTTLSSIPGVLLIAAAVLMMQVYIENHPELFATVAHRADLRLFFLCVILGITSWTGLCRLLRGETLKLKELEYIQAAHAFGVRDLRVITRHILPNVMHIVLIAVVMDFSGLVLAEAVLSYVGVGVDPSMNSFGTMINAARLEMAREPMVWWSLTAAFVFMFVLVLAANLLADAVRDALDPRLRLRGGMAGAAA
ncbi:MAG: ABC transporter permease [Pseudomonadota bacterium]